MAKHPREKPSRRESPELPEAKPMPGEASPSGTEGVDSGWAGGRSNLGEVMNPEPQGDHTYSTKDVEGASRVDVVARFVCDHCGQGFPTDELLNVHRRTAHHRH